MMGDTRDVRAAELIRRSRALYEGSGEAIDWVAETRRHSPRLDRESDSLTDKLRRTRNLATRLGRAAGRSVSVGFFGLSQAGKSYLISALAAGESGELETQVEGRRLNFIQHVNPPGHGKEATGLVTRFTRRASTAPRGYPLELSLFSEVDLAKVLGNAFFNDFDREQVEVDLSPGHLRRHLAALQSRRTVAPTGGVSEDDVVDLLEYFEKRFPKTTEQLKADYWPTAIALAPYLEPPDRAALFSVLWGEVRELTETYLALRRGLAETGHADAAYAPLAALVRTDASGELSQGDSIMNVDILERLGRDDADCIEIVPRRDGTLLPAVTLPRSLLAALTTELRFVLAETPRTGLLEQVDLLDFPGYRGRLAVANLAEVRKQLQDDQVDPVAQLVLRGKVAFLFERYTDDQEMNLLVLCAPSHKQSDVKDLGPVLETWVHATQGADPATRARRDPGLVWAFTMFDFRLNPVPSETEDLMRKGWEGMMKLALLERFGAYDWLREWSPGKPFDNLFLVRKPRMATAVIETDATGERAILPGQRTRLDLLRHTFCEDPTVRKHLADPQMAWDAMLSFNDGGISRLADYLGRVAAPEGKLARIGEQLDAGIEELVRHRFGPYFRAEGAAEVDNKRRLADRVVGALRQRPNRFAALLGALQPPKEGLRALYLRVEESAGQPVPATSAAAPDTGPPSGAERRRRPDRSGCPARRGRIRLPLEHGACVDEGRRGCTAPRGGQRERRSLRPRRPQLLGRSPQGAARGPALAAPHGPGEGRARRPDRRADHRRRSIKPRSSPHRTDRQRRVPNRSNALSARRAPGLRHRVAHQSLRRLPRQRRPTARRPPALAGRATASGLCSAAADPAPRHARAPREPGEFPRALHRRLVRGVSRARHRQRRPRRRARYLARAECPARPDSRSGRRQGTRPQTLTGRPRWP